jgi:hypothetical protein
VRERGKIEPWYALRHAGPDMMTTSPERRRIGTGLTSRVRPPMRKIAELPSLLEVSVNNKFYDSRTTYEMDTKGDVAQNSERSTWPIKVSYAIVEGQEGLPN